MSIITTKYLYRQLNCIMKISIVYYTYKKNIETNILEEYVNFVDLTKKPNKHFKILIILVVVILCLFLLFVLFNCLKA